MIAEKDLVFFADSGKTYHAAITSASANDTSNRANEMVRAITATLDGTSFLTKTMRLAASLAPDEYVLHSAMSMDDFQSIPDLLQQKAALYDLMSWLREAVKAKERIQDGLVQTSFNEWAKEQGITLPDEDAVRPGGDMPQVPEKYTEPSRDELLGMLSATERSRYLSLLAYVSVLGKYIGEYTENGKQNTGAYLAARKEALKRMTAPVEETGTGQDTKIYKYSQSIPPEKVDEMYYMLQQEHREIQKELNGMYSKMEKEGTRLLTERVTAYETAMAQYHARMDAWLAERKQRSEQYNMQMEELREQFAAWKREQSGINQNRKIIIPDRLATIYDRVSRMGK